MAGSLLRPPLNINPLTKKNKNKNQNSSSTSSFRINKRAEQHKFLIKKYQQRQRLLSFKKDEGQQRLCEQLQHLLQQQLKYCRQQSFLFKKLLLLLFAATNDSRCCWTAIEKRKDFKSLASTTAKIWSINYEQQQQQKQHQQYIRQQQQLHLPNQQQQQQLLQLDNKVLATTKKFCKNLLLNRKKVEKLQLQLQLQLQQQLQLKKEFLFHRKKQLLRKLNFF